MAKASFSSRRFLYAWPRRLGRVAGTVVWLQLRWFPLVVLMYAAGIAALSARRFGMLAAALMPRVHGESSSSYEPLVSAVLTPLNNLIENFKALPGHERDLYPRSEHQFVQLREPLEQLLFLGEGYEPLFDRFEVLLALAFADCRQAFHSLRGTGKLVEPL
jgi:hypothetical protein